MGLCSIIPVILNYNEGGRIDNTFFMGHVVLISIREY